MTFQELLGRLEKGTLPPGAYLIVSASPYYEAALREALSSRKGEEAVELLSGDDTPPDVLSDELSSRDMFSENKVYFIKRSEKYTGNTLLEEPLRQSASAGKTIFFYTENETAAKKKPFSALKGERIIKGPRLYEKQIADIVRERFRARGISLTPEALQRFLEINENSIVILLQEADKLILFLGEKKKVTREDLDHFSGTFAKWTVFDCLDRLREKKKRDFFTALLPLIRKMDTGDLLAVLTLLFNEVKKLLLVHAFRNESGKALAARIGMHPYLMQLKDYKATALRHSEVALKKTLTSFSDADIALKRGEDPYNVILKLTRYLWE